MIQPEELKTQMDQKELALKIIDVRHELKYYLGHIPGPVQVWRHELENKKNPVPGMPLPAAALAAMSMPTKADAIEKRNW